MNIRKEALVNLRELCTMHPSLLTSSLSAVVNAIIKLFMDGERDVRKAVVAFVSECFEPIDKVELQPFLPLLIMYTCSAMTHIYEDVRLDAIRLIDLWVTIAPDVLVIKHWDRVTNNYLSLLTVDANSLTHSRSNLGTTSPSNATLSSVKSAENKSHLHLHKNSSAHCYDSYWFFMNFLESRHAKESFKNHFEESQTSKDAKTLRWDQSGFTPLHPSMGASSSYLSAQPLASYSALHLFESNGPKANQSTQLIETFHSILVGAWLETAPSVFNSSNISLTPALQLLEILLKLSLVLWRAMVSKGGVDKLGRAWLDTYLQQFLKHTIIYFPFGANTPGNRGGKVDSVLLGMNIMVCELTSLFLLARTMQENSVEKESLAESLKSRKRQHKEEREDSVPEWTEGIVDYVLGIFGAEDEEERKSSSMTSMSSDFKPEHLTSLLPTVWGFLNCLEEETKGTILDVS
ncbi:hypothetical protein BDF14DRAFT_1897792 [Spinellus fusiger]|nr:hypothetical protein BDF14DRAFT_1897792 [Spinellus fusiger]